MYLSGRILASDLPPSHLPYLNICGWRIVPQGPTIVPGSVRPVVVPLGSSDTDSMSTIDTDRIDFDISTDDTDRIDFESSTGDTDRIDFESSTIDTESSSQSESKPDVDTLFFGFDGSS